VSLEVRQNVNCVASLEVVSVGSQRDLVSDVILVQASLPYHHRRHPYHLFQ